jgi:hypothetical protein
MISIISFVAFAENNPNQSFMVKLDASDFHIIENSLRNMNTYCRMVASHTLNRGEVMHMKH